MSRDSAQCIHLEHQEVSQPSLQMGCIDSSFSLSPSLSLSIYLSLSLSISLSLSLYLPLSLSLSLKRIYRCLPVMLSFSSNSSKFCRYRLFYFFRIIRASPCVCSSYPLTGNLVCFDLVGVPPSSCLLCVFHITTDIFFSLVSQNFIVRSSFLQHYYISITKPMKRLKI